MLKYRNCIFRLLVIKVFALIISGCIVLPIPTPEHGGSGVLPDDEETLNNILKVEQTSRADIILQWGSPSETFENERFLVYEWLRVRGYLLWFIGGQSGGIGGAPSWGAKHYLCLEFNSNSLLKQYKVFERQHFNLWDDVHERMLKWVNP